VYLGNFSLLFSNRQWSKHFSVFLHRTDFSFSPNGFELAGTRVARFFLIQTRDYFGIKINHLATLAGTILTRIHENNKSKNRRPLKYAASIHGTKMHLDSFQRPGPEMIPLGGHVSTIEILEPEQVCWHRSCKILGKEHLVKIG
jgi:hypothetical protein